MSLAAAAALALAAAPATGRAATAAPAQPLAASDAPHWRLLGPFRAGWATMVEGVPSQPDTVYFGGAGGGLWRTRNAGRTWTSLFDHGPVSAIGALAVAPSDPRTLYIGTGQPTPRYDVQAGLGVFRSTDGGATWASAGLQATRYIGRIWVDPRDAQTVLVGAQGRFFGPSPDRGVYRSTDGGRSWTQTLKLGPWTGVVDLAADPADPKTIFAAAWEAHQYPWQSYFTPISGAGSGLYRSTDGGVSWTRMEGGGWPAGALGRISLAAARTPQGLRLYAEVDAPKAGGLYRSDDGGAHWLRANAEQAASGYYASRVTAAPDDPDTVYLVGQSIRRCSHGGTACEIVRGSPGGDDYHFVWINPLHPDHMAAGSDQGAIVSVDGGKSWSDWYNQPTGQFYHLAADDRFPYRVYSGQQDSGTVGILSRSDYGAISLRDWTSVGGDERDYDIPDPVDPDIVYGSGLGGRVSKWDARTGQVQNVSPWPVSSYGKRPTTVRYRYNWVTPLAASHAEGGPPAIYLGAQLVFRSTDQGRSWAAISGDLTGKREGAQRCDGDVAVADARACGYGTIVALQPSPRHAGELWVGTDDGLIQLTRDGGAHWADVTPPSVRDWQKVQTLDASALQDGVAYAAVDGQRIDDFQPHVLATHDYGASWRDITADLPRDHLVSVVRADPVQPGLLYAGTDAGVFASLDDGGHWSPLQQDLPTAWVRDLLVHGNDLVAATQGRAIWVFDDLASLRQRAASPAARTRLFAPSPAVRVRADANRDTPPPPETALGRNPPAGAVIDYEIQGAVRGPVRLEIADAQGRRVRAWTSAGPEPRPDAEVYFDKAWLHPAQALSAAPGVHRFTWDLHAERPATISADYAIAAVWNRGVPIAPEGALAPPGDYTVTLTAGGRSYRAPLHLSEDPRVTVAPGALEASYALSARIGAAMAQARTGYGEMQAVETRIDALYPQAGAAAHDPAAGAPAKADRAGDLPDQARTLASGLRQPPAAGQPQFETVSGALAAIESDLEGADAAPTAAQLQVVDAQLADLAHAQARWDAFKAHDLVALNAQLRRAGRAPVVVPLGAALTVTPPDAGQDLP